MNNKNNLSISSHNQEQLDLLEALFATIHHFFGNVSNLFKNVQDPRIENKTEYPLSCLGFTGILMFLFHLGARRQIKYMLKDNSFSEEKFNTIFNVNEVPHGDTLNDTFSISNPNDYQEIICKMVEKLIRKKVLSSTRLLGKHYTIAVDGTGIMTFKDRHCPHCLKRKINKDTTIYYHPVLEAKLVTPNGFAFSIMSEFIENSEENISKQDCELNAFYRLANKLKQRFPRLPISLCLDGLFAGGPTFKLCESFGWKFMIVLTDKDLPSVNTEFEGLSKLHSENKLSISSKNVKQNYRWINEIYYKDCKKNEHDINVIECIETKKNKSTKFKWVTNFNVSDKNIVTIANRGGRIRWKIENEGFNVQKNGGTKLEHAYSNNEYASKIFYYLLQISHIISQLLSKGSLLNNLAKFGSVKNMCFKLLEAWRNVCFPDNLFKSIANKKFQIRFDSS